MLCETCLAVEETERNVREAERSAVVAHLRKAARDAQWGDLSAWTKHRAVEEVVFELANAIERGEHSS
jgi:hypothetical protein